MSTLRLTRHHIRLDVVVDDLAAAGYESVSVIDRPDGTVHVDAIAPSGMRIRLDSLDAVYAALSNGEDA